MNKVCALFCAETWSMVLNATENGSESGGLVAHSQTAFLTEGLGFVTTACDSFE